MGFTRHDPIEDTERQDSRQAAQHPRSVFPTRVGVDFLREQVRLPEDTTLMVDNADALDAGLCVLAAVDFLLGRAMKPQDEEMAEKEGWIWVRRLVEQP